MPTDKPRYTITVDPELQKRIEDFQFDNRFKSQTKAIIALMQMGLSQLNCESTISIKPALSDIEEQLIENYRSFNEEGQEKVVAYISDLTDSQKYKKHDPFGMAKQA